MAINQLILFRHLPADPAIIRSALAMEVWAVQLISFTISNYRSITKAHKLPIRDLVVLIGPNNEGKSNILRALVTALQILTRLALGPRARSYRDAAIYDWERDFPIALQEKKPDGETVFQLEFQLSDEELDEFRRDVKSKLSGSLPIRLEVGPGTVNFKVPKKGPGQVVLSRKAGAIAKFIGERIDVQYIPAIRSARAAVDIVENMLARELYLAEENERYQEALALIEQVQQPILDRVSMNIKESLIQFLPEVQDVNVTIEREERYRALRRSCKVVVDDGTPTDLELKGDGVKSLAAISLMRRASDPGEGKRRVILAVEEPESHLHPDAIHELRSVLFELAEKYQVIITTHCPLLADRREMKRNILVEESRAKPAKDIKELRSILGVRTSDNLESAELVLIVEGEGDRRMLEALLRAETIRLKEALEVGTLAIESIAGGGNLSYKLTQLRSAICTPHVYLDNDDAGQRAVEKAETEGLLSSPEYHLTACTGMQSSEIEDMLEVQVYGVALERQFGIRLDVPQFRSSTTKWSDRVKAVFQSQGKIWNDKTRRGVKETIAACVESDPKNAMNEHKSSSFTELVRTLEEKLKTRG